LAFCNGNKLNKNSRFRQKAQNQFSTPSPLTPASVAWPYIASFCAPLVPPGHRRVQAHGRGGRPGRLREPRRGQICSGAREKVLESDDDARRLALTRRRPDLGVRVPARAGGGARTSSSASSTTRRQAPLLPRQWIRFCFSNRYRLVFDCAGVGEVSTLYSTVSDNSASSLRVG